MRSRLLELIYPRKCVFCMRLLAREETDLCTQCRTRLPYCAGKQRSIPYSAGSAAVFYYEGDVREAVLRYKFGGLTAYAAVYAEFLAKCIDENGISCDSITWVPLSRRRLRQRGYDQARLIAEELAKRLGLPCECLLVKRRHTRPQSGISNREKRKANAAGAYAVLNAERVKGKRVLLVDDIVTTGATLASCAGVLADAGCAAVFGAAAATRS